MVPCFSLSLPQHLCSHASTHQTQPEWPSLESGKLRPRRDTTSSASCSVRHDPQSYRLLSISVRAAITICYSSFSALGIPDDVIEKGRNYKLVTEVTQDGDTFSWTQIYPTNAKVTNTFTVGKECDMETIGGKKFKVENGESRNKAMKGIIKPAEGKCRMNVL